jgi:DIS3-like exonuclease 2
MLLANYLVAERLITHGKGLGTLRQHPPPLDEGLDKVIDLAQEACDFTLDASTSAALQESLNKLSRQCQRTGDTLIMQAVTSMLINPMQPAEYFCTGEVEDRSEWRHFALNIPYYTHFTSPIRRYPDVMVHRVLQDTLEEEVRTAMAVKKGVIELEGSSSSIVKAKSKPYTSKYVHSIAEHCNAKRMGAKRASERSDRVFLSIFLDSNPIMGTLGLVIGIGQTSFTVLVPSLGIDQLVNFNNSAEVWEFSFHETDKAIHAKAKNSATHTSVVIKLFAKIKVNVVSKRTSPIDVIVDVVGPWIENVRANEN